MSKGGIIVLIVAALVFCGLGFVIGQVVQASGSVAGSENDPVVTQSYVDKLVGKQVSALQAEIDEINAALKGNTTPSAPSSDSGKTDNQSGNNNSSSNNNSKASSVKVTSDAVNIRASASTEATVVGTAAEGDVLAYLGSTAASDGTWYNVKMADGTNGYIASWLCSEPY